jgi:hypothetical protein
MSVLLSRKKVNKQSEPDSQDGRIVLNGQNNYQKNIQNTIGSDSLILNIPPRFMWGWGYNLDGCCGNTSFQAAMLYYGTYSSALLIYYAAKNSEVILDNVSMDVCKHFKLNYDYWYTKSHENIQNSKPPNFRMPEFTDWMVRGLMVDYVPIIGVFWRVPIDKSGTEYDHIVTINGYITDSDNTKKFIYNDWWTNTNRVFEQNFSSREEMTGDETQLPYDYSIPNIYQYGIMVKGNVDPMNECYRARLVIDMFAEPDYFDRDGYYEHPMQFNGKLHITGLKVNGQYMVLCFTDPKAIPEKNFRYAKDRAGLMNFTARDTYVVLDVPTMWSEKFYAYRVIDA